MKYAMLLMLQLFLYSFLCSGHESKPSSDVNISVLMVVDREEQFRVFVGDYDGWEDYYKRFLDMAQKRMDMLQLNITLQLVDVFGLTKEENKNVFVKRNGVWDPNMLGLKLDGLLRTKYLQKLYSSSIVFLFTRRPLMLPALRNQRTAGSTNIGGMCSALKTAVIEDHGDYVEVNTMAVLLLQSMGVNLDGKRENTDCPASETYIMGNKPKTVPVDFEFSKCTKASAIAQISWLKENHGDCIKGKQTPGPYQGVKPYYGYNEYLTENMFCDFVSGEEACYLETRADCAVVCCRNYIFFHKLFGRYLPLPDGTTCDDRTKVCVNGRCVENTNPWKPDPEVPLED